MTLKELKNKWNKEKEAYKIQEVGCGVQIFVKDIFQSEDVFALERGLKSKVLEKRKNEFLEEEKTKEQRRADIIIYISSDIIIPVEIEKYQNIEAGTKQLLSYQTDLDKKYGILTDGFTWRFYNNNIFREFNLNQILDKTELFLEFWKEYIKPEFYYLLFFEPFGQLQLIKKEKLPVEENRQMFFEDITKLIRGFKNKLEIEGYFNGLDKKTRGKQAVEITYAYIIQFVLYKTLVDNEFGSFREKFNNIVEKIHQNLKENRYRDILGIIDSISAQISKNIYRPFIKEQEFINQKLLQLYRSVENKLSDVSPWLDIFVFIKKYDFANIENEIFGYIYENYLKELYEEGKKGQYFTDYAVVNFMLQQIGFTPNEIEKNYKNDENSISLIDPACGSGTFLYSAVNKIIKAFGNHSEEKSKQIEEIVNNNILGLDIEEFPLYLAEMNVLMRMLPLIITEKYNNPVDKKIKVFLTKDSISEFLDTGLRNTMQDLEALKSRGGQLPLWFEELDLGYKSYVREETDLEEMKKSLEKLPEIPRRRFDYVIGNPPYVGYNQCSKQKVLIFELMKQGKASLNNIYGVNLHSIPNHQKKYAPKPNLYIFFIALGIALLKDNGKLCYIIPQTVLVNPNFDVIRYHLAKFTTIEKIITFSGKMFIGRGLKQKKPVATSSLIFVLNRKMPSTLHKVEIINYKNPNDTIEETLQNILASKKISKKEILQNKLFQNVVNWNFIKQDKKFLNFYEAYQRNTNDISIYYEHILAERKFGSRFYFDIGYNIDEKLLQDRVITDSYQYPKLNEKFYSIQSIRGYWPNERNKGSKFQIKLLTTNQGYNLLDSKYKIIWSYNNTTRFFFTGMPVIWARNKILGIGSENKNEIMYLFALLNSQITKCLLDNIIKIKQEDTRTILVSLQIIKDQIRIPKITQDNQQIKEEVIKRTEEMLVLEKKKLSDFMDFSKVMLQKFDKVSVEGNDLILEKDDEKIKLAIKENQGLVKKSLNEKNGKQMIELEKQKISLSELKDLLIIDYEKQQKIKDYIDNLVFALYFNIRLENLGLNKADKIKEKCSKNPYYKLISNQKL